MSPVLTLDVEGDELTVAGRCEHYHRGPGPDFRETRCKGRALWLCRRMRLCDPCARAVFAAWPSVTDVPRDRPTGTWGATVPDRYPPPWLNLNYRVAPWALDQLAEILGRLEGRRA